MEAVVSVKKKLYPAVLFGISAYLVSPSVLSDDLLSLYQLAQENDRTFSAARNQYEAVKQTQKDKKGLYYPNVSLSYEHVETDQQIKRSDNEVFGSGTSDYPTDDMTLSLTQPVFRWDYLSERRKAKAEVRQAEYQFVSAEQELILRTAEAYLLTLAASDNAFVTTAELEAVNQQLSLANKRLDVGLANATEVYESEARYQLNQSEVILAENTVVDRQEGLRVIVGRTPGELMPLQDQFSMVPPDPADPDAWIARAMDSNLAIKSREAAVEVAAEEYGRQRAGRYPTLDFVARFNNRDTGGSLFGGGSEVETTDLVLRADWTIFQGGSLRARIKEALYNKQRAEDELELERSTVRRETRNAYLGVVSSIARANALKASLDAQEQTVKSKQKAFETGSGSNIEVLDAKRDFFFVQRDYLEARYDYLLSMLNLKRQVGSLSPDDLALINNNLKTAAINSASELEEAIAIALPDAVTTTPDAATANVEFNDVIPASVVDGPGIYSLTTEEEAIVSDLEWLFAQDTEDYVVQSASYRERENAINATRIISKSPSRYFASEGDWGVAYLVVTGGPHHSRELAGRFAEEIGVNDALYRNLGDLQMGRCNARSLYSQAVISVLNDLCDQNSGTPDSPDSGNSSTFQLAMDHAS